MREESYRNVSVLETEGTAALERNEVEMPIYAQLVIQSEDKITTGDDGLVSLMLDDDKYAIVEESSEVIFELAGKKNNGSIRISLNAGSIYNDIENPLGEDDSYEIVTPDGVMAVRGTKFRVSIVRAEDGSYRATIITVFDGKVYVQVDNSSGEDTMVEAGEEAVIMKYFGNEEQDEEEAYLVKDSDNSIDYSRLPQWLLDRLGISGTESGSDVSDESSEGSGTEEDSDETSDSTGNDTQSETDASNDGESDQEKTKDAESGTKTGSETGSTAKSDTEAEAETGTESESESGTEAESETETGDGTETGTESDSGSDSDTDSGSGSDSDSDTDSDSDSGSDTDTESESDVTAPTAEISVDTNTWKSLLNTITFGLFFKETQTVTITASDDESGIAGIYYFLSNEAVASDEDTLAALAWTEYSSSFTISPENTYVIYARAVDGSGNTTYISSEGLVLDSLAPVFSGITDQGVYCGSVSFTVTDESPADTNEITVTVDGSTLEPDSGNTYTITASGQDMTCQVEAADFAGNSTVISITVNQAHTCLYAAEGTTITESCAYCSEHSVSVTLSAPSGTLVYDGTTLHEAELSYIGTLSDGNNLTVAYQKDGADVTDTIGAGTYTATVTLGTESVSVEYTVEKAEVTAPTIDSKVYSGENQTADVAAGELYEVSENAGGTEAGTYPVVLKLTDSDNYQWSTAEGTVNGDELTLSFTITEGQNVWTSELSMSADSWVYGDTAGTPAAAAEYGEVVYTYYKADYTNLGSTQPTDAGNYYVQASVAADGVNYEEIVSDYVEFTIGKRAVTLVWSDAGEMNLVYDGTAKTAAVTLENVVDGDDVSAVSPVCLSGDTTNVTADGFIYTVTELTGSDSANYELPDSTESEAYYITAAELSDEDFTVDTADQTYTGSAITLSYSCNNTLITENDYTISYESNIDVGNGQLVITGTGNFTGELTYLFAIVKADLTVTWPENLTGSAGDTLSSVSLDSYTAADGNGTFSWNAGDTVLVYGSNNYTMTYTPDDTDNYNELQANISVYGNDVTAPTAQISVDTNIWKSLLNTITFGLFFQESQTVTITASDDESGVAGVYYYLSNTAVETDEATLSGLAWTEYSSLSISPENTYVIYAKAVDGAGNTVYISSEGLVLDSLAPVFNGIMNQGVYCGSVSFTVTDQCEADTNEITVTVDGNTLEPDSSNTYTISASGQDLSCEVTATDSAGNSAVISVTVNQDHTYVYETEGTTITESCAYCSGHSASVTLSTPSGTLVYDGSSVHEAELTYTGTLSEGNNLTVTYQKDGAIVTDTSGAGTYTATITLGTESVSVEYTVAKAEVEAPAIASKEYSGQNQTADVAASTLYEVSENAGGADAGTYQVVLKLTDSDNYQWSTAAGTVNGDELTLSFEITTAVNAWTETLTITGWTYGDTVNSPSAVAEFGSDTITYTYYSEAGGTALTSQPTAAGTWYVQASIAATDNYSALTSGYVSFTIVQREVTLTWSELDESSLVYDGTEKTVTVTLGNLVSGDNVSADTSLIGDNINVTTEGFSYSVTELTGNDSANYALPSDVSSASYVITAKPLSADLFTVDETDQAYTGSSIYVSASANNTTTLPGSNYTISYTDNVNPGQATVTITGMNNYQGTLTYHFNIIMSVTVPSADTTVYTYNDGAQTYGLTESSYYEITGNVQTDAGTYTVTVSLNDTAYYKWSDNTTSDKTYTFTINKADLEVPTVADREYTGGEQPSGLSSTDYTVSENETEHINAGTYTVDLTLTNENYQWSGSAGSDTVTVSYHITQAENEWLSELSITDWTYGSYDAALNAPSITAKFGEAQYSYYWYSSYSESYYEISDITEETGGAFYVKATVAETENYQGLETDYVEFTVYGTRQLTLDNFTLPESMTYTGEALEPLVANDTQQTYTVTYENNIEPGTATVIITGTGAYTGSTLILTFEIVAADSTAASVSRTLDMAAGTVDLLLVPVLCGELFLNGKKRKEKQ
ncbi:MAG: FecR domain-containing protein [Lachnospiraceae bacterium]|nr:FecR domain-containing protein [Lachnospiraceae bacterium]